MSIAGFPTTPWAGLTGGSRVYPWDEIAPGPKDWDQLIAELVAIQTHLLALKDASGNITGNAITTLNGANNLNPVVTKGTDPAAQTLLGSYYTFTVKDIILAIGSSAVASKATAYTIPANSIVFGAAMNVESTITLATATKIGLGVAATLDKYGKITGGTKNNKVTTPCTPTAVVATEPLLVYAVDNSGAAAGTIQNGSVRISLLFGTMAALPDAA